MKKKKKRKIRKRPNKPEPKQPLVETWVSESFVWEEGKPTLTEIRLSPKGWVHARTTLTETEYFYEDDQ